MRLRAIIYVGMYNNGLAQYKSRWGTGNMALHYFNMPNVGKSEALIGSSCAHAILKRIITRMPELVNRMSSELLYKHLA